MPSTPAPVGRLWIAAVAALALTLGGCSDNGEANASPKSDGPEKDEVPTTGTGTFPGQEWETIDAAAAGMDRDALDAIAAEAEAGLSNCLVVTRGGKLVDEWYWQDTGPDSAQEVYSASKSYTSVLIGMAVDEGALSVDDKASEWIPEWKGTPSEDITVEQLLNNTSGRFQDFQTDYVEMAARAADKTEFSIGLDQQHDPGTVWVYNNAAIQTLEQVFSAATDQDVADFAAEQLFDPLGMQDSAINRDQAGNPLTFMGVQSTCRDMARFGLMALRQGNWDGQQIVSEDWMARSTGSSSQELNDAYGWLWWLNRPGTLVNPAAATGGGGTEEQLVPGAPADMFFASGLGGQVIAIDPATETVVVRLGPATYPAGTEKFERDDISRVATEAVVADMAG